MKIIISLLFIFVSSVSFAKGLTPDIIMRNGLTDEQIDAIFAASSNAQLRLTKQMWQNMEYRLHRFDNMKGWLNLGIQGKLGDEILRVSDTNKVLVVINDQLNGRIAALNHDLERLYISFTNQVALTESAERARQLADEARILAEAEKEKAETKLATIKAQIQAKRDEYQEKYDKGTVITKPIYKAIIAVFDALLALFN